MVKQYRHTINWVEGGQGGVDDDGYPLPAEGIDREGKCRHEFFSKGSAREVRDVDGTPILADCVVYMPFKSLYVPNRFTEVEVIHGRTGEIMKLFLLTKYAGELNYSYLAKEVIV